MLCCPSPSTTDGEEEIPMGNQQQAVLVRESELNAAELELTTVPKSGRHAKPRGRQSNKRRIPMNTATMIALPFLAVGALMGCGVAETSGDADNAGVREHALSEPVVPVTGALSATDTDSVLLTGAKIDFGGDNWDSSTDSPSNSGTLFWSVVDGFYTPHLTGYLYLQNANGKFARMHVSHWDGGGGLISTQHGGIVQASGNGLQWWTVDLTPINLKQIVEAHVCTELSDDGVDFPQVACKTYIFN